MTLWSTPGATADEQSSGDVLRLLSPFDELLVACKDRSAYDRVSGVSDEAITFFQPSLLLNGRLVGSWQKTISPKSGTVHLQLQATWPGLNLSSPRLRKTLLNRPSSGRRTLSLISEVEQNPQL